jgi:hypothetical protein
MYSTRDYLEALFGARNILAWADLDNQGIPQDIFDRISLAIEQADEIIDSQFNGSAYLVPLSDSQDLIPPTVTRWSATLAGVLLYEARGYSSEEDPMELKRQAVMAEIADVLAGKSRLMALRSNPQRGISGVYYDD